MHYGRVTELDYISRVDSQVQMLARHHSTAQPEHQRFEKITDVPMHLQLHTGRV